MDNTSFIRKLKYGLSFFSLVFAGEMVFSLPFHIPRFFRPTLLDSFSITNTLLGDIFALYGIIAMLSYFPGGLLADRFHAKTLLMASLCATALGGLYFYTLPSIDNLHWLFGYWGFTSVFLFWSAMIKATRDLATSSTQGIAFGLLDGGRGLVASLCATFAVLIFQWNISDVSLGNQNQQLALKSVILFYSCATGFAAILIALCLPKSTINKRERNQFHQLKSTLTSTNIWLQAGVVITAYCCFKSLDNFGLYATQVLNMDDVQSSTFTTQLSYLRPIAAITAGLIADRLSSSKLISILYIIGIFGFLLLTIFNPSQLPTHLIVLNIAITSFAVYALRGIYFSLLEESKVPSANTGAAVGVISVLGFTPDIFFASITGRILDANNGLLGFQNYFFWLSLVSMFGLLLSYFLAKRIRSHSNQ